MVKVELGIYAARRGKISLDYVVLFVESGHDFLSMADSL
jgi:hypothetical protein